MSIFPEHDIDFHMDLWPSVYFPWTWYWLLHGSPTFCLFSLNMIVIAAWISDLLSIFPEHDTDYHMDLRPSVYFPWTWYWLPHGSPTFCLFSLNMILIVTWISDLLSISLNMILIVTWISDLLSIFPEHDTDCHMDLWPSVCFPWAWYWLSHGSLIFCLFSPNIIPIVICISDLLFVVNNSDELIQVKTNRPFLISITIVLCIKVLYVGLFLIALFGLNSVQLFH